MAKTYEARQKSLSKPETTGWSFLDLQNRKQTGDLEKKILHFRKKNDFKVFNFSSSRRNEGVSTILANLVKYIDAQKSGKKILVVDANLQAPSLHKIFKVSNDTGLTDVMKEEKQIDEIAIKLDSSSITLLCSGKRPSSHDESLDQERFSAIINQSKSNFDYILIDSASILTSSDAVSTAVAADVTFLIIESLMVQKEVALKSKSLLADNECLIGGVVINKIQQVIPNWMYKII